MRSSDRLRVAPRSYEMLHVPPSSGEHDHLEASDRSPSYRKEGQGAMGSVLSAGRRARPRKCLNVLRRQRGLKGGEFRFWLDGNDAFCLAMREFAGDTRSSSQGGCLDNPNLDTQPGFSPLVEMI